MLPPLRRLLALSLLAGLLLAQTPEFAFYTPYRAWMRQTFSPGTLSSSPEKIYDQYRVKSTAEGIGPQEIDRRVTLLRTRWQDLENDFWNVTLTKENPAFNTAPNAFLVELTKERAPGRALDMGAGEGRNAIYLSKLGWKVTAVDPADKALALAKQRAEAVGAPIKTVVSTDTEFDYGHGQWDLILFSWVNPKATAGKVHQGLAPGGILVVEGDHSWWGDNGLLNLFPQLRTIHYQDTRAKSDFFARREMQVVRFCAEKKPD